MYLIDEAGAQLLRVDEDEEQDDEDDGDADDDAELLERQRRLDFQTRELTPAETSWQQTHGSNVGL